MRRLVISGVLLVFVSVLAGCGSNTSTRPEKIPPMPKGDAVGVKPDSGGSMNEK